MSGAMTRGSLATHRIGIFRFRTEWSASRSSLARYSEISPDKSASGAGSKEIPAGRVPTQSDHSPHCGNAVCSLGTAPSFAQRHAQEGTESALTHRRPDGKGGHKFGEGRAVRETGSHKPLLRSEEHTSEL